MRTRYAAAGLGQDLAPLATVGHDPMRRIVPGGYSVTGRWAQRAANAGIRYNGTGGALIAVDGLVGPVTLAALRSLSHQFAADAAVTNSPASARVASTAIVPTALEARLAAMTFVPDPPVSAATIHAVPTGTTSHTSPTTGATVSTGTPVSTVSTPTTGPDTQLVPSPDVSPSAPPVIADEGSTRSRSRWFWPAIIGGTGVTLLVAYYALATPQKKAAPATAAVKANRRRRRRRRTR